MKQTNDFNARLIIGYHPMNRVESLQLNAFFAVFAPL